LILETIACHLFHVQNKRREVIQHKKCGVYLVTSVFKIMAPNPAVMYQMLTKVFGTRKYVTKQVS
jgi:protein gp37